MRQRYAILLDAQGEITLPALELPWWDVEQDRARIARVEATTLNVSAPETTVSSAARNPVTASNQGPAYGLLVQLGNDAWAWLLSGATVLLLLYLGWCKRNDFRAAWKSSQARRQTRKRLLEACANNDAPAARRTLIAWARAHWRDAGICSFRQVTDRADAADWKPVLAELDASVFAGTARDWRGAQLALLIRQRTRRGATTSARQARLPDPYGA